MKNLTLQQKRMLVIAASLLGLLVLISAGVTLWQSTKAKVVIVDVAPNDTNISLDGKKIAVGTHFIEPGKHQFVLNRAAFVEKKIDFEMKAGETRNFDLYIVPDESEAALEWMRQNIEAAAELDGYVSRAYEETADRVYNSYPILSQLPITEKNFRIDHGVSQKGNDFALYVQASDEEGRTAARETLKYLGYDLSKLEIIYRNPDE